MSQREAFGTTINKFQALRHTMVEHATEVEHCKIFNYAAGWREYGNREGVEIEK